MQELIILNSALRDDTGKGIYIDTYFFTPQQHAHKGNMSIVYKGYRLSDIQIAVDNNKLAPQSVRETLSVKKYYEPHASRLVLTARNRKVRFLLQEFNMINSSPQVKPIAIKVLFGDLAKIPMYRERFVRETRIRIEHPNLVKILDYVLVPDQNAGKHHIIMEYLDGNTLEDILKKEVAPMPETRALGIIKQVLEGLRAIHSEQDMTHRDIKTGNIMILEDNRVKIIDFGIAKHNTDEQEKKLTGIATFIGTLAYASPEQVKMFGVAHQSDLWSAGIVLYEMLSGTLPFVAPNDDEIKRKILEEPVPAIDYVSKEVNALIQKSLAKNTKDRYQSAEDFIKDINQILVEPETNNVNWVAIASITATALIILFFAYLIISKR